VPPHGPLSVEYGRLRVEQILNHWAEHDLNHLEQVRAALRA